MSIGKRNISIVIPTLTGSATLPLVLDSIRLQNAAQHTEVIVVIDGPSPVIETLLTNYSTRHATEFKTLKIKKFPQNKGRFFARYEGALQATNETLLFIDDRTELQHDYLDVVTRIAKDNRAIISSIREKSHPNFISKSLYVIRRWVYKNQKESFHAYDITEQNFEKSPKGTAGFCVDKSLFVKASKKFLSEGDVSSSSNDDTRLLKHIVAMVPIHRSPELVLVYTPRERWQDELRHIYKRGPMFIDYYLKSESRYFRHLLLLYVVTLSTIVGSALYPRLLIAIAVFVLAGFATLGLLAGKGLTEKAWTSFGILLIFCSFVSGIYVGTIRKIFK